MIFEAILIGFFSNISPTWGLFFIVLLGGKHFQQRRYVFLGLTGIASLLVFFFLQDKGSGFVLGEIAGGVFVPYVLINFIFHRTKEFSLAILSVLIFEAIFSLMRQFWYKAIILQNLTAQFEEIRKVAEAFGAEFSETYQLEEALSLMEEIVTNFGAAIWVTGIVTAAYLGFIFFAKKQRIRIHHRSLRFPYFCVYGIIFGLLLTLIPTTKILGLNMLLMLSPLYFFQGISILDYYWRPFVEKSKWFAFLLVLMLLFNYFFAMLIVMMGLLDVWFNFRKLKIQEEIDESNSY